MTIAELVEKLREFPEDTQVVLLDGEYGEHYDVERVQRPPRDYRDGDRSKPCVEIS